MRSNGSKRTTSLNPAFYIRDITESERIQNIRGMEYQPENPKQQKKDRENKKVMWGRKKAQLRITGGVRRKFRQIEEEKKKVTGEAE